MEIQTAFSSLKKRFGTHTAAAEALGMTKDHYRALRNGRANVPRRTEAFIVMMAEEVADPAMPPRSPAGAPTSEARV